MLSPKQERFCLLIVQGEIQSKAYELAGYRTGTPNTVNANASRLANKDNIKARLAELRNKAALRSEITLDSLTHDLLEIRDKALSAGSFGPAVAAVTIVAKLHGFMIERSEVSVTHRPAPLPTKILELSEQDWVRQFGQGLQEKRLQKLETIVKRVVK
jgi:hypothetical protein